MTKEEALAFDLALEALKHLQPTALTSFYTIGARDKAITAIKQARSAPVQSCYCPNCEAMGKELAALSVEREKAKHNEEVLMNALWKACGDDEQLVEATIESQGELK